MRIGCVEYLNTLPFYYGIDTDYSFVKASPTELNDLIRRGELDVSVVSSLEYARNFKNYLLLPGLCIGAEKYSESVYLISKVPISSLGGKQIILCEESLSSQILLKILLNELHFKCSFKTRPINPAAMLQEGDACLLIGDEALYFELPRGYFRYDLCSLWNELTQLPFCFALWVVRREFAREHPAEVRQCLKLIQFRLQNNLNDTLSMIEESVVSPKENLLKIHKSIHYLSNLRFQLDETLECACCRYFELAKEIGELDELPKIEYFENGRKS